MAEREVIVTDGGGGTATGLLLGIVLGALVLLAVLYFTGAFGKLLGGNETKIDVEVSAPKAPGAVLTLR